MWHIIKILVKKLFAKFGFQVKRIPTGVPNPIHLWDTDEAFISLLKQVRGHAVVGRRGCFMLYQLVRHAISIDGDIAEIGVYKGGTAKLIAKIAAGTTKTVHIFDTFSGMPPTDITKDLHKEGDFSGASLEEVKKYLEDCGNVRFYPGFFPSTAGDIRNMQFCFVHIDVDIYKSVADCCEFFYPRMVKGGIMVFDDYGSVTCPGAKMAIDEFFADKPEYPCYLLTGESLVIKL
ncbi:MAG: TylF/MycF/NovP-related O-methyltransferase [Phycisphaerae bacterium]|jgi:O-methyltransferase